MKKFKKYLIGAVLIITIISWFTISIIRLWLSNVQVQLSVMDVEDVDDFKFTIKLKEDFRESFENTNILDRTSNCKSYFSSLFSVIYNSKEQINASQLFKHETINNSDLTKVAMSYVIHDYPEMFEILFHLTFKPYNSYCIYIDPKSTKEYQDLIFHILNCYQNNFPETKIIIPQLRNPVNWGGYSLLEADLRCLEELYFTSK